MKLYFILFLLTFEANADNMKVEGEISFKLNDPSKSELYKVRVEEPADAAAAADNGTVLVSEENNLFKHEDAKRTVGPVVECMYQVPEETQVQALLSNMMNELTKMFVRAHDIMNDDLRRRGETRFKVVSEKNFGFFEDIYSNMIKQYLIFYNSTAVRVDRSGRKKDPCENQEEMKGLWKDLLESSLTTFRLAAFKCLNERLKVNKEPKNSRVRVKMSQYLLKQLAKIKMSQLVLLCDKFQICYNDLMRRNYKTGFH